ncbi:unnamed protein product [Trifolium pratense]|uniref:Uncharacterized protein n=1 Tax=Trifolium pratense TaxID=57577 RepID=A0ACB0K7C3_TRIPR|nr:unnamed protein product [Trifolium pratense]
MLLYLDSTCCKTQGDHCAGTSLNHDMTQLQLLETLRAKDYGGSEELLLGELQFAFIAFLMGQLLEAFLQWKSLDSLLFGCTVAPFHKRTQLFTKDFFSLVLDGSVVDGDILKWV